jgi:SAM-dependent methyltransferase
MRSHYWADDAEAEPERARLELLQQRYDALTFRRLRATGPLVGRTCLEVAAGAGSVAVWLAGEVGPSGSVVATDLDPRFLDGLSGVANIAVRRHDILTDPLEEAAFDLVHCRALLCHLGDPLPALRRMAAALRPGGWLLVEEADYVSLAVASPEHRLAASWERVVSATIGYCASSSLFDPVLGRRLPALVSSLGLEDVTHEGFVRVQRGGTPAAEFLHSSMDAHSAHLVGNGVCSDGDMSAFTEALTDPSFRFTDACSFATWGLAVAKSAQRQQVSHARPSSIAEARSKE